MATLNRRRLRAPKSKSEETGPDAHVSRVRHLLDAQLRLEDALETAEDDGVIITMETSLGKGNLELIKAMNNYLQRPFSSKSQSFAVTNEERAALRELRKSITEELLVPSDLTKERLDGALESLARTFKITDGNGNGNGKEAAEALEWEPKRYRVLDDKDPRKTGCVRIHINS
jgi:hypothetical protein